MIAAPQGLGPGGATRTRTLQAEQLVTSVAVALVVVPTLHHPALNFTVADLLFCISGVLLLVSHRIASAPITAGVPLWLLGFGLFWGGLIVSSLLHDKPERALIMGSQFFFSYLYVPFVLFRYDEAQTTRFIKILIIAVLLVNIYGIVWYAMGDDPDHKHITGSGRLTSLMADPNSYANVMALTMPFVLYCWLTRALPAALITAVIVALVVSIVLTASVSGMIATLLGAAVFLVLSKNGKLVIGTSLVLGLCVAVGAGLGTDYLPDVWERRVLGAFQSGDLDQAGTYTDRMALIFMALDVVGHTTWIGMGADQFRDTNWMRAPVHNTYLLLWSEGGLPSLIGWLTMLTSAMLGGVLAYRRPQTRAVGALGIAIVLVFAFIANNAAHMYARFWVVPLQLSMALVIGALARPSWARPPGPSRDLAPAGSEPTPPPRPPAVASPAALRDPAPDEAASRSGPSSA